jgi:hypothetical protein
MHARRRLLGVQRIGIVLALILTLPAGFALWSWAFLGYTPSKYLYIFLAAFYALILLASAIEWIVAGFAGDDEGT